MAKDDERPQFNPKHRIAGAIILVSLAVIFVPMLLDETAPPLENNSLTEIPMRDDAETRVVVVPVTPADAEPAPSAPAPAQAAAAAPTKAVEQGTSEAKPKPVAARPGEQIASGWIVQVGTFANADNAARVREQLRSKGFTVDADTITLNGRKAVRLSVGPYRDKPSATRALATLQKDLQITGILRAYP